MRKGSSVVSKREGETHPSCTCFAELVPDPAGACLGQWAPVVGSSRMGRMTTSECPKVSAYTVHRSMKFYILAQKICWRYIFCFGNYSCKSIALLLILLNSWLERCCVAGGPTSWLFATQTSLSLHQFSLLFGYPYSWLIKMMWFRGSCFEGCWLAQPSSA